MEPFYDGDLKDIWESDFGSAESLKISCETDVQDWFLERDVKDATVELHDKLISDALLNGTLPIKSEHSYSLNSHGDSVLNSPRSCHMKWEASENECYPATSLKTVSSNIFHTEVKSVDPKCLSISLAKTSHLPLTQMSSYIYNSAESLSSDNNPVDDFFSKSQLLTDKLTVNLKSMHKNIYNFLNISNRMNSITDLTFPKHGVLHKKHNVTKQNHDNAIISADNFSNTQISTCDRSSSPDLCCEVEKDHTSIKNEPLSPNSSCPPSPKSAKLQSCGIFSEKNALSIEVDDFSCVDNLEFVCDNKAGYFKLTPSTQKLIESKDMSLNPSSCRNSVILSKVNIKSENVSKVTNAFGLPLTPPSSTASDVSEGNLTPEHLVSPLSPNNTILHRNANIPGSCATTSRHSMNNSSTRQPINTPLISSQPKGSTGTLVLTEEEKRTLLAEGYSIPQKLPLTKSEEKSLKKIRRKIKNKISAQESRRKKKEYMDQLERRVEILVKENNDFKKRIEHFENLNANLLKQLQKLQTIVNKQSGKKP